MSFSAKTEEWLKQWPEDVQKGYRANPYMEFLIHQYTQNLINNFKSGGVQVQVQAQAQPQQVDQKNNDKPQNDNNNDSSEGEGFGGIFDEEEEEEGGFGSLFD